MTAVTIAIAVIGFVGACNVAVVIFGYSDKSAKLWLKKRRSKHLVAPIVKDVVRLAIKNMRDAPSLNGRRRERAHARRGTSHPSEHRPSCLSCFSGLNEEESWLWKTQTDNQLSLRCPRANSDTTNSTAVGPPPRLVYSIIKSHNTKKNATDEHFVIPRRWTSKITSSTFLGCA